jgi:hypothetical protein
MIDPNAAPTRATSSSAVADADGDTASDDAVRQAMAGLVAHSGETPEKAPPNTAELKYKLTMMLFPAILLVFVALYVASLASGIDPEVGLFRAGGVALVLAVLGRAAIGILGDETRLVLSDRQIVAMARSGSVREYLAAAAVGEPGTLPGVAGTEQQPATTAQTAASQTRGIGGKE